MLRALGRPQMRLKFVRVAARICISHSLTFTPSLLQPDDVATPVAETLVDHTKKGTRDGPVVPTGASLVGDILTIQQISALPAYWEGLPGTCFVPTIKPIIF